MQVSSALAEDGEVDVAALGKNSAKYFNCVEFLENGTPAAVADFCQQGNGEHAAYYISKNALDEGRIVTDAMWGSPTMTIGNMGSTLDDILLEGFTKIIVGQESIDYFDTLVAEWEAAGGAMATQEINETYGG